jgi:hypothetical protein
MLNCFRIRLAALCIVCFALTTGSRLFAQAPAPDLVPNADKTGVTLKHTNEDFASLTLAGSDLRAVPPVPGDSSQNPEFVREVYQVRWRANDPIDLYVIRPRKIAKPPVVLYLYGFPSGTERFRDDAFCRRAVSNGAAAVGFASALTGPRYAYRPMKEWFVSEMQESVGSTVHDVQMILNYLETRGDLDMTRVGMFGEGSGGAIAILAAAADPRIKALDLLQPWGDWPDWLAQSPLVPAAERPNYLTADFLKKMEPLEPLHYLPQLSSRAIRIQLVDHLAPELPTKRIESTAPKSAQVRLYKNSNELIDANPKEQIFQWIGEQLAPAAQAQSAANPALASGDLAGGHSK